MPTEKPRVTITMSEAELERLNEYRFKHKMKNQTQAVLSLVEKGFESIRNENCKATNVTSELDKKQKTAPTTQEVIEAIDTLLYSFYGRPATDQEIDRFSELIQAINNMIKG